MRNKKIILAVLAVLAVLTTTVTTAHAARAMKTSPGNVTTMGSGMYSCEPGVYCPDTF